jgi:hypothetical protein
MQPDELTLDESWTKDWHSNGFLWVDDQGNMLVRDGGEPNNVMLLLRDGFDAAGNPRYDWNHSRQVLDLSKYPWIARENLWMTGPSMDSAGNIYAGFVEGNCCSPTKVRLAKFGPDGRQMWVFGHKTVGIKSRPGEYDSVHTLGRVIDGILYVADYSSPVDLLTTDGLYLTTLLKAGGVIEEDQYSYFGENFQSDEIKDPQTGKVYLVINPHCFVLPIFEVTGLDTVKKFNCGELTSTRRRSLGWRRRGRRRLTGRRGRPCICSTIP